MNKARLFKGFALINFICLLTLFLCYRGGYFDKYFFGENQLTSPNGGTPAKVSKDAAKKKNDSLQRAVRLSSSKSMIIIDHINPKLDSAIFKSDSIKFGNEDKKLMYSSKSGIIIPPKKFLPDSTKKLNEKKGKKEKKTTQK